VPGLDLGAIPISSRSRKNAKAHFFNTGIYTVPDAAHLTGVSVGRIRRWLRGYRYTSRKKTYESAALWHGQWEPIDQSLALGFLDLIEIRFVDAFLKAGVTWATLLKAREKADAMFDASHPFCTNHFVTDGREIFVQLHRETGEASLIEIVRRQQVFAEIVKPFLKELEFEEESGVIRWWPLGNRRLVVLDPTRNFGRPIVSSHGVPTEALASAMKASGSIAEVTRWFEVTSGEVRDAVEYEQRLAA
jgi:uncharacterized protein (DUF433 family)